MDTIKCAVLTGLFSTAFLAGPAVAGDLVVGGIIFSDLGNPLLSGINDVNITVKGNDRTLKTTTVFNGVNGFWSISGLDEGLYVIEAELAGWCFNVRLPEQTALGGPPPLTMLVSKELQPGNGNIQMLGTRADDPETCVNGICTDAFFCATGNECILTACRPDDPEARANGCTERCGLGALCANGTGVCDPACMCIDLPECAAFSSCADLDGDQRRDNPCVWWACVEGTCQPTPIQFADLGGQFGACPPDGVVDGNDRFHALNCFANQDTTPGSPYPCDVAAPHALRADAGGAFSTCVPDGVCDGNEAFLTLNEFGGVAGCRCTANGGLPGPAPIAPPTVAGAFDPPRLTSRPGTEETLDIVLPEPPADLHGYQLGLSISGGLSGHIEVVDMVIDAWRVAPGASGPTWRAFNRTRGSVVAGFDTPPTPVTGYLVTVIVRASHDAAGVFVIELASASQVFTGTAATPLDAGRAIWVVNR